MTIDDPLATATDRMVAALLGDDRAEAGRALSDWSAELIGRATVQAASATKFVLDRLLLVERKQQDARRDVDRVESRLNGIGQKWSQAASALTTRLDRYEELQSADIAKFMHEQLPAEERDKLIALIYTLATKVEALERRVGDDSTGA